jgi:uncharacterized membrane protein
MSTNLGGFSIIHVLSDLVVPFFAMSFSSLEKGKTKKEKKITYSPMGW